MTVHQLQRRALRFPGRKETPPMHAARLFPGCGLRGVVMKNHTGRFWNRERRDGVVSLGPACTPCRAFDEGPLVDAIPNFGRDKNQRQPTDCRPRSVMAISSERHRRNSSRARRVVSRRTSEFAFPKPRQAKHARHSEEQRRGPDEIVPASERLRAALRGEEHERGRTKNVAKKNPAAPKQEE